MSTPTAAGSRRQGRGGARAGKSGGGNRLIVALVGVAVVVFVGVVAVLSVNERADLPTLGEFSAPVAVDGLALPPYDESSDPTAGVATSPVITARDLDDREVVLGAPGQAQVLVFLAHWCPVCDQELPVLRNVIESGNVPADVEIIAVLTGLDPGRPNWPPDVWLRNAGVNVVAVRDDVGDPLMRAFGLRAYPAWAVIDADGTIQARRQGLLTSVAITQLLQLAAN
jgi:cytochrome c biogenesis protein CcmG/thiol:disulfide interchange protein DsbE